MVGTRAHWVVVVATLVACSQQPTSAPPIPPALDVLPDVFVEDSMVAPDILLDVQDATADLIEASDIVEDSPVLPDAVDVVIPDTDPPALDTAPPILDIVDAPDTAEPVDAVEPDTTLPEKDTANPPPDIAPPPPPGDCCEVGAVPACEKAACSQQVCALDSYCCDVLWDSTCVACAQGGLGYQGVDCSGLHAVCGCEQAAPTFEDIAKHWAPVWYHDTDDKNYIADYITAVDFDGDLVSENNWENLESGSADLSAVIYWAVIETTTHWYVYYMDFHPRDWAQNCWAPFQEPCHENDMEGAMVVVRRDNSYWGAFEFLYTEAHNVLHLYSNDNAITADSNAHVLLAGDLVKGKPFKGVTFEDGSHPELYVESKGHGVCALYHDGDEHCKHSVSSTPPEFGGNDGVVYRYKGFAQVPSSGNDHDVSYELISFETAIWPHRFDTCDAGCLFDTTMTYDGVVLGKAFDGESFGDDKANPPWAWDDPDDGPVYRGDFFFRPAKTLKTHLSLPGVVSQQYTYNPYLESL